jgi:hypothetical protein
MKYKITKGSYLYKKLKSLPVIKACDVNKILAFKAPQIVRLAGQECVINAPTVLFGKNFVLVAIAQGCNYKPLPEMDEILLPGFIKLLKNQEQPKTILIN